MSNRKAFKLIRALSALLAALFLFSPTSFFTEVKALPMSSYAFDTIKTEEEFRVAVGVRYGSSAYPLHSMTSPYGFVFGEAEITRTEHNFIPLYTIEESDIAAVVDTNLTIGYQSCEIATSESTTDIGGYHVEITNSSRNVWDNLGDLQVIFASQFDHVFPAYINGQKTIRIGSYPNYSSASAAAAAVGAVLDDFTISVASPSSEGVCFLNSDFDTILFEYSGEEGFCGGVCARQIAGADYSYLYYSRNSCLYDGVFCFKRYLSDAAEEGLSMINLVRMQEYVEGVIPNEISNTWPIECLRAFALMVRSFAIANINRHYSAYGFDVCSSSCCQVYQGRKQVNDTVIEAVRSTRNEILVCGDTIVESAYSSSQGGYTVGSQYVWGGSLPYLVNQPTPWEDYSDVRNGLWTAEITEKELATAFKNAGYSTIKGNRIVDFSYQTSDDSPYLYSFTGIDEKGNSATATRAAKVKSLFGSTVKSSNFTIAKGELTYTYTDVLANRIINLAGSVSGKIKRGVEIARCAEISVSKVTGNNVFTLLERPDKFAYGRRFRFFLDTHINDLIHGLFSHVFLDRGTRNFLTVFVSYLIYYGFYTVFTVVFLYVNAFVIFFRFFVYGCVRYTLAHRDILRLRLHVKIRCYFRRCV